jgi:DNA-binding response OmpR family regulator
MIDAQTVELDEAITQSGPAKKILFADDELDIREYMETILLEEGYQILAAADGYEAVTLFNEFHPDLVILDVHMPLMNGTDACAIIRQDSDIPIIMFTADDDANNVKGAIDNGTTDFVPKSTGISELAERVGTHLANHPGRVPSHTRAPSCRSRRWSLSRSLQLRLLSIPTRKIALTSSRFSEGCPRTSSRSITPPKQFRQSKNMTPTS